MTVLQTSSSSTRLTSLAAVEARRYARHPVFLVGLALCAFAVYRTTSGTTEDLFETAVAAAFFIGVFGMVVGFRLTRSVERSGEALESSPVSVQERVAALLLACLVPGAVGAAVTVLALTQQEPVADWVYGTWSASDRVAIFLGATTVSCIGGPVLGIAAARWLRFPGAVVVPVVAVVAWVWLPNGYTSVNQDSTLALLGRMSAPFTFFSTVTTEGGHRMESWRGEPWAYLAWTVLLCVLGCLVALLKGAEGETRTRLRGLLGLTAVLALSAYAVAVTAGADHTTVRSPAGVSRV